MHAVHQPQPCVRLERGTYPSFSGADKALAESVARGSRRFRGEPQKDRLLKFVVGFFFGLNSVLLSEGNILDLWWKDGDFHNWGIITGGRGAINVSRVGPRSVICATEQDKVNTHNRSFS